MRLAPELKVLRHYDRIKDSAKHGPVRAQFDLTNLCNHNCPWCEPVQYRKSTIQDKNHSLTPEIAIRTAKELVALDCKTVYVSGGGEPMLHPSFGEVVEILADGGVNVAIVTNGVYIDKWFSQVLKAKNIRISLDSTNEYEHIQQHNGKNEDFQKIFDNIRRLTSETNRPEVGVAFVVDECVIQSVKQMCELADSLGVDFAVIRPNSENRTIVVQAAMQRAEDIVRAGNYKTNIAVDYKRLDNVFYQRDFKKCHATKYSAFIGANGDLQACCDRRDIVYGNLYENTLTEIWNSQRHQETADKIVPAFCMRCMHCETNKAIEKYVVNDEAKLWLI